MQRSIRAMRLGGAVARKKLGGACPSSGAARLTGNRKHAAFCCLGDRWWLSLFVSPPVLPCERWLPAFGETGSAST